MKRNIRRYFYVAITLLITKATISQTTTIDYIHSGLSTTPCNVFNPSVVINGANHSSHAGGVSFNATDGILLSTTPQSTTPGGTAFFISYNFTPNNNYSISITAKGNSAMILKCCVVPNLNQFTTSSATGCTPDPNAYRYILVGEGRFETTTNTSGATYNIPQFTIPGTNIYPLLIVWSSGGNAGLALDNLSISQISITQTPIGSFSISPTSLNIPCGSSSAQTFTANNNSNIPNVTNHVWNLGSVNNGWLYNGNPAPQTISTGTTKSIALTPDCGKVQTNVSATITAGGTNFNSSNSCVISISQPSYTITGVSSLCSGNSTYTLNGAVCNSSIVWTPPPANLGTLTNLNASPTTLIYGGASGNLTLTANVTSCGVQTPVTLPIHVGPYSSSDYTLTAANSSNQPLYWCPNQTYGFSVNPTSGSNYTWTIPSGWTFGPPGPPPYVKAVKAPVSTSPPTGSVAVSFTEPCGTTITKSFFVAYSSSACTGTDPRFTFSPNPAPSYLYASVASGYVGTVNIKRIQIVRSSTGVTVFDQSYGTGVNNAYISTSSFATGAYNLRIYDGSTWAVYQFVK